MSDQKPITSPNQNEVSPELRDFYCWWLDQRTAGELDPHAHLCKYLFDFVVAEGDGRIDEDSVFESMRAEQADLFYELYKSDNYPFGSSDWTAENPRRLAHVIRFSGRSPKTVAKLHFFTRLKTAWHHWLIGLYP